MISTRVRAFLHAKNRFQGFQHCEKSQLAVVVRLFSSSSLDDKHSSFTVSYLVNSCGFSLETAKSVLKKVHLKHPKRPDTALRSFFGLHKATREHKMNIYKRWGWSENELDFVLMNYPHLFLRSDEKISNTMEFLVNKMGCKSVDIARHPKVLCFSLEKRIIPRCSVYQVLSLKGLLQKEVSLFMLLNHSANEFEERFVTIYKKDVPQLLNVYQGKISLLELGFTSEDEKGVKSPPFFNLRNSTRERKMKIYERWGLFENEIDFVSKIYPRVFLFSDEKISNTMDFLVNKMGYKSLDVVRNPNIFYFNLEMRIIPRCLVYKVLLLKGLVKNELSLSTLLTFTANEFKDRFVTRYEKDVPQLLNIYQGKITPLELRFTWEDVKVVTPPPIQFIAANTFSNEGVPKKKI